MNWHTGLAVGLFFIVAGQPASATELFSVSCEGGAPAGVYFATFDIDSKAVVFETSPMNVDAYSGVNVLRGDITSVRYKDFDAIEFMLSVTSGKLSMVFDRERNTMKWPGIDDGGTFRPTLIHRCIVQPPRNVLSFQARDPVQKPISIHCEDSGGDMYFTMDAGSKQALFERGPHGRMYRGEVTTADVDEITLAMNFDSPRQVVWSSSRRTITLEETKGDPTRPRTVLQCQDVAPRTMMIYHGRLSRQ